MWGSRTVNVETTATLIDHKTNDKAVVVFNPKVSKFESTAEPTNFEGVIYTPNGTVQKK